MDKKSFILIAFAPAKGGIHSPVQVQKLLFVLDKQIHQYVEGPHFNFEPYDYGPFDKRVYEELEDLAHEGDVEIIFGKWKSFRLTEVGQKKAEDLLNTIQNPIQEHIRNVSKFVRTCSFSELVSAIYKAYPEMKVNSVFKG